MIILVLMDPNIFGIIYLTTVDTSMTIKSWNSMSLMPDLSGSLVPTPMPSPDLVITMQKDIKETGQNLIIVVAHTIHSSTSFLVTLWLFVIPVQIMCLW